MLGIVEFLKSYWKQVTAIVFLVALVSSVLYLYHDNKQLSADLALANVAKNTAIHDYNNLFAAQKQLNQQIDDLQKTNDSLKKDIADSQTTINQLDKKTQDLIAQIAGQKIPVECQGKIDWLKQQALILQEQFGPKSVQTKQDSLMKKILPAYLLKKEN